MWVFDELQRQDLEPKEMRGHAYELATRTLFIGLRAGLSLEEVEALYARFMSDRQRTLGNTSKKERPRRVHAKELAGEIVKENPGFSYAEIVEEIPNRWRLENVDCFSPRWLAELVPRWFPSQPKSRPAANLSACGGFADEIFSIFFGRKPASRVAKLAATGSENQATHNDRGRTHAEFSV